MEARQAAYLWRSPCGECACRTKNVNWLGAAPLTEVAQQIAHAHGPSGPNSEYLYRLADTMRKVRAGSWTPAHNAPGPDASMAAACCTGFVADVGREQGCLRTQRDPLFICLQMEVDDASLFELEAAVRAICKANATQNLDNGKSQGTASEIHSLGHSQS